MRSACSFAGSPTPPSFRKSRNQLQGSTTGWKAVLFHPHGPAHPHSSRSPPLLSSSTSHGGVMRASRCLWKLESFFCAPWSGVHTDISASCKPFPGSDTRTVRKLVGGGWSWADLGRPVRGSSSWVMISQNHRGAGVQGQETGHNCPRTSISRYLALSSPWPTTATAPGIPVKGGCRPHLVHPLPPGYFKIKDGRESTAMSEVMSTPKHATGIVEARPMGAGVPSFTKRQIRTLSLGNPPPPACSSVQQSQITSPSQVRRGPRGSLPNPAAASASNWGIRALRAA